MGAPRRVQPKPLQRPHPPLWGATSSPDGHREIGRHGVGLCSFTVGVPPEELGERLELYRGGLSECKEPVGKFVNSQAATFTMVHCAPTAEEAEQDAAESFVWYVKHGAALIGSVAELLEGKDLGTYQYAAAPLQMEREGLFEHITFPFLRDSGSAVVGDPDQGIPAAKRYEAIGCDLLPGPANPNKGDHDKGMQSIKR